jgi:hypothetical protein
MILTVLFTGTILSSPAFATGGIFSVGGGFSLLPLEPPPHAFKKSRKIILKGRGKRGFIVNPSIVNTISYKL